MKKSLESQTSSLWGRFGPPIVVWCLSWLVVAGALQRQGQPIFSADSYARADSGHYLSIARDGYRLYPCQCQIDGLSEGWCGTVGWFPLYSYLLRAGPYLGLTLEQWGCLLTQTFRLGFLGLLWSMLHEVAWGRRVWLLSFVGFFPGGIYHHAIFPISLLIFLHCLAMHYALKGNGGWCALFGGLAAMSYSTGFVFSAPLALWIGSDPNRPLARRLYDWLLPVAAIWLGFAGVLALMYVEVGRWDAFFLVQEKYGHQLTWPLRTWEAYFRTVTEVPAQDNPWFWGMVQTVLIGGGMVACSVGYLLIRGWRDRVATLGLLVAGAYWLFPLMMGLGVSLYRAESLLVPIVLLLRRFPTGLIALLTLAELPLFVTMTELFAAGVLV